MKRLGLIVRADMTGLGIQTRAYFKHLKPHKTLLVDISKITGTKQHYEWYDGAPYLQVSNGFPSEKQIEDFLKDLDVVLTAETFYNNDFCNKARYYGVKTINVDNPEFYDHIKYPEIALPDVIILPSVWKENEIRTHAESKGTKVYQIHHPVDRNEFPFTTRKVAKFIHIAGKPASHDRNGTWDFLQACPDGVVITQSNDLATLIRKRYRNARVLQNIEMPQEMYTLGDVLVLPRKYGGNCLPLNEALSSGMPVIMPDIEPNNHLLPKEWLVPATITDHFEPRTRVDIYSVHPQDLADKLEYFRNIDIEQESLKANDIANTISWKALKDRFLEVINS